MISSFLRAVAIIGLGLLVYLAVVSLFCIYCDFFPLEVRWS